MILAMRIKNIKLRQLAQHDLGGDFKLTTNTIKLLPSIYEGVFTSSELKYLEATYKLMYPTSILNIFHDFINIRKNASWLENCLQEQMLVNGHLWLQLYGQWKELMKIYACRLAAFASS